MTSMCNQKASRLGYVGLSDVKGDHHEEVVTN
jgi:hypothetical protein